MPLCQCVWGVYVYIYLCVQDSWSGLPFPSPGDLPEPGIEPGSPALQGDSLISEPPEKSTCAHRHAYVYLCRLNPSTHLISRPCMTYIYLQRLIKVAVRGIIISVLDEICALLPALSSTPPPLNHSQMNLSILDEAMSKENWGSLALKLPRSCLPSHWSFSSPYHLIRLTRDTEASPLSCPSLLSLLCSFRPCSLPEKLSQVMPTWVGVRGRGEGSCCCIELTMHITSTGQILSWTPFQ